MEKIIKNLNTSHLDFSKLSANQINLFDKLKSDELQSYINKINAIKNVDLTNMIANGKGDKYREYQLRAYVNALSDLDSKQAALLLHTQGLTNAQVQQTLAARGLTVAEQTQAMTEAGLLKTKQKVSSVELQQVLQTKLGTKEKAKEAMASMGLKTAEDGETASTVKLTSAKL